MSRKELLFEFIETHNNVNFNFSNVEKIMENLEKADNNGCLRQFLLNEKPYQSAFPFVGQHGARGKDQVSIVLALNLYGAKKPGFAAEINQIMKELANGTSKQAQCIMVLMRAQMQLQELEISLINFVDRELLVLLNKKIRSVRGLNIFLMILLICGSAFGLPGFTMLGLFPLTFVSIGVFIFGIMKLIHWIALAPIKQRDIDGSVRSVGECLD